MSKVQDIIKELQHTQTTLDLLKQSGNNELGNLFNMINEAKSAGNLEPENYEQLMSSDHLGAEFQHAHYETYNENIKKMQEFLSELERKLNEYLQIS